MNLTHTTAMANLNQAYDRFQAAQQAVQEDNSQGNQQAFAEAREALYDANEACNAARTPNRCYG